MIIIYTQNETFIRNDAEDAKSILLSEYGHKLGLEAYSAVKNGREGMTYRKNGGPLVAVVSKEQCEIIREKEMAIGML